MLRKYQVLFTDFYDYVTNLLWLCYDIAGSDTIKPQLHCAVNEILRWCKGSVTVATVMRRFGRINFTPAEQLSVIIMSLVRGEAYGGRRFAFDCSLRPVADYEENKMQEEEEEEVCLDKRLVAAQSAPQSV